MRCNRKTACFAVTPRRIMVDSLNITEIWQLRRREKAKVGVKSLKLNLSCNTLITNILDYIFN